MQYQSEKTYQAKVAACEKHTPDLITDFGPMLKSYQLRCGITRCFDQHDQIVKTVNKTVGNSKHALASNVLISKRWVTRRGKTCHQIQQKLLEKTIKFYEELKDMEHVYEMEDILCAWSERDWQGVRTKLKMLKVDVRACYQRFEKLGLDLVKVDIPREIKIWRVANPNLPDTLTFLRSGIFSAIAAVEYQVKWFEQVVDSWARYIRHHIGSRNTEFRCHPFFPHAESEVYKTQWNVSTDSQLNIYFQDE